jgi:hypothetical protein
VTISHSIIRSRSTEKGRCGESQTASVTSKQPIKRTTLCHGNRAKAIGESAESWARSKGRVIAVWSPQNTAMSAALKRSRLRN